ncbi:HAD family hydrolase [Paenibacillus sp. WLX2291]|uniref:HAD family hydrolase n=1 Tax=Paenibacillus sp. WLX2291 TaxID=3296934 RepID=UPI0039845C88
MIKAVIFDLDGTLLDRDLSLESFIRDQYDRLDVLHFIDKDEYVARFIQLDNKGYMWKDIVYASLIEEYQIWNISADELLADYIENFKNHCIPFPHLTELLEHIISQKIKLGMITNGFSDFQLGNVESLGIRHYFEFIMVSELEGIRKPDVSIFKRALERLEIEACEAIYVGDHPVNDVMASRRVGMKGIWKCNRYDKADFEHDGIIYDLMDLKHYL